MQLIYIVFVMKKYLFSLSGEHVKKVKRKFLFSKFLQIIKNGKIKFSKTNSGLKKKIVQFLASLYFIFIFKNLLTLLAIKEKSVNSVIAITRRFYNS